MNFFDKKTISLHLYNSLENASKKRIFVLDNEPLLKAKIELKNFQIERLKKTHLDLLNDKDTSSATNFFLKELYGFKDLRNRDIEAKKLIPLIIKMFPKETLKTITQAFILDSLTEDLETSMAKMMQENNITKLNENLYWYYYKKSSTKEERIIQLNYVKNIGQELCLITSYPFLEKIIKLMRVPAKLSNLMEIHNLLENGFTTFKQLNDKNKFIDLIYSREMNLINEKFNT